MSVIKFFDSPFSESAALKKKKLAVRLPATQNKLRLFDPEIQPIVSKLGNCQMTDEPRGNTEKKEHVLQRNNYHLLPLLRA